MLKNKKKIIKKKKSIESFKNIARKMSENTFRKGLSDVVVHKFELFVLQRHLFQSLLVNLFCK